MRHSHQARRKRGVGRVSGAGRLSGAGRVSGRDRGSLLAGFGAGQRRYLITAHTDSTSRLRQTASKARAKVAGCQITPPGLADGSSQIRRDKISMMHEDTTKAKYVVVCFAPRKTLACKWTGCK